MNKILVLFITIASIISITSCHTNGDQAIVTPAEIIELLNNDLLFAKEKLVSKGYEYHQYSVYLDDGDVDNVNVFSFSYYDGSIMNGSTCSDVISIWSKSKKVEYKFGADKNSWVFYEKIQENMQDFPDGEYERETWDGKQLYFYNNHFFARDEIVSGNKICKKYIISKSKESL